MFKLSNVARIICDTKRRALSLSSAGTIYQGASRVLVADRHFSYALRNFGQDLRSSMSAVVIFQFFFGRIQLLQKPAALLVLRFVQENLDDAHAVIMEVTLEVYDGSVPVVPNLFSPAIVRLRCCLK